MATYSYLSYQAREKIGRRLRDFRKIQATEGSDGSQITDSLRLIDADNAYAGTWGVCISAFEEDNQEQMFRVVASHYAFSRVQIAKALPKPVNIGDVFHLFNISGNGWAPDIYTQVIADVVDNAWPLFKEPVEYMPIAAFNSKSRTYQMPEGWCWVTGVEYWHPSEQFWARVEPRWLRGDIVTRSVIIEGERPVDLLYNCALRFLGYKRPQFDGGEHSPISVPENWLVNECCAILSAYQTTSRERLLAAERWQGRADMAKPDISVFSTNNMIQVAW